jgi:hypothetical protein
MFGKESSKVDHAGIMNPGPVGITARCHYIHCTIDLHHIFVKMLQIGYDTLWGYTLCFGQKSSHEIHCIQQTGIPLTPLFQNKL